MKKLNNTLVTEHIQLTWRNWNKICNFIPKENFIEGIHLTTNNTPVDYESDPFPVNLDKIGLKLNINDEKKLAITNDYIIKQNGKLKIMSELQFERKQKLDEICQEKN